MKMDTKNTVLASFLDTWVSSGCFPSASLLVESVEANKEEFFHCVGAAGRQHDSSTHSLTTSVNNHSM